jgi:hypothetical protein
MTKRANRVTRGLATALAGVIIAMILVIAAELALLHTVDTIQVGNVTVMASDSFYVGCHRVQPTGEPAPCGSQLDLGFASVVIWDP